MVPFKKRLLHRDAIFVAGILVLISVLLALPNLYNSPYAREENRYSAEIVEVDNSLIQQYGIVKAGSQRLKVKVLDGPFARQEIDAANDLIGKMESDKMFKVGDRVFIVAAVSGDEIIAATAYEHYRLHVELILVLIFGALLIGFAGWSGAKALLSFVFAVLFMWKIMLPGMLNGFDPLWIALGAVMIIGGATLFLVAGVGRIALVAWLGSAAGIIVTTCLALFLFPAFRLHGAILPFSETLLYSGFETLNLGRLFIAAVFVGASGAVIDVAIDVAAAMHEVALKRPDLSVKELTKSGFKVGRAMVSTMVTTLLMAYVSGYMALLMVLLSKGIPPVQILNLNFIAAEIMKTVVGSFGLVTVAPLTAIIGGILYVKWRPIHGEAPSFAPLTPRPLRD